MSSSGASRPPSPFPPPKGGGRRREEALSGLTLSPQSEVPYSTANPLIHGAYLAGKADRLAGRLPKPWDRMSPAAARAYYHGFHDDRWHRRPCGKVVWLGEAT